MRICSPATQDDLWRTGAPTGRNSEPWLITAYWDAINEKPMSLKRENRMRAALGLLPVPQPVTVPACPDCGGVHTGRCNGVSNPVVIVKRQRPAKPAWVVEATANLARLLEDKP